MAVSYDLYRLFYAVAQAGSLTHAAQALHSNQPNVTRAIQNLEQELGTALFLRSNRGVTLTAEGERLFHHVQAAQAHLEAGERELLSGRRLKSGLVTIGATESLFLSLSTVLNPGDEVIIPTPAFSLYESITRLCRGVPVALPTEDNAFQIDPEALARAITPKTKAVILTSPNNPTGCIYTQETLNAVHDILKDKPIFVLCDDVYRTLVYTDGYHSFSEYQDMRDRIIVIQSFSKPYAMTGWRLGYCLADAPIRDRMQIFHQYSVVSAPSFVQPACVTALQTDTSGVVEIFRRRRDYVYRRLVEMGLSVQKPEGAFYMFIDIRPFGMDSLTFCEKMLREGLVGLIPGVYFGTEGYMRLSYCYSDEDLKEGLDRIQRFIGTLR